MFFTNIFVGGELMGEKLTSVIVIYVTPSFKKKLEDAARKLGFKKVSTLCRFLIVQGLKSYGEGG